MASAVSGKFQALFLWSPMRIMLLGKSGSGKSASGNSILGTRVFTTAKRKEKYVTKECASHTAETGGREVFVIDTPDLLNPQLSDEERTREREKIISLSAPGLHAFLLVMTIGEDVANEQEVLEMLREMFGEGSLAYTMVLFTRGADLYEEERVEHYIQEKGEKLQQLVMQCEGGAHVLENKNSGIISSQVSDLLNKIDAMVKENGGNLCPIKRKSDSQERLIYFAETDVAGVMSYPRDQHCGNTINGGRRAQDVRPGEDECTRSEQRAKPSGNTNLVHRSAAVKKQDQAGQRDIPDRVGRPGGGTSCNEGMSSENVLKGVMVAGLALGAMGLVLWRAPVVAAVVGGKATKSMVAMGVGIAAGAWLAMRK